MALCILEEDLDEYLFRQRETMLKISDQKYARKQKKQANQVLTG
jgi:hypothetical protein